MRPLVIPQIKKPTMMYGLGVLSHLIGYERELSEKNIMSDMKDKELQKLLEENSLLSGLAIESEILNSAKFTELTLTNEEKNISLEEGESAIITLNGRSSLNIAIATKNSNDNKKAAAIIMRVKDNSDVELKIIYENRKGNESDETKPQISVEQESISMLKMLIGENSKVTLNELFITNSNSLRRTNITLKGNGSKIYPNHAYFTYGNAKVDFKSEVTHYGENSESDMKVKGIINESSSVITQGHVTIKPSAFNSNGYQQEDLILVGEKSIARPIPNLEIGNNEVKCSHGATVSNIDEETLFYLQSRGIRKHDAISLLLSSFLSPIMGLFTGEEKEKYQHDLKIIIEESGEIGALAQEK